jgi:hypothetical protein
VKPGGLFIPVLPTTVAVNVRAQAGVSYISVESIDTRTYFSPARLFSPVFIIEPKLYSYFHANDTPKWRRRGKI